MRIATFSRMSRAQKYSFRNVMKVFFSPSQQIRGSIVVSISACHAEDPGSIPGPTLVLHRLLAAGFSHWLV